MNKKSVYKNQIQLLVDSVLIPNLEAY